MENNIDKTICAICTPLSEGAISIIRISGQYAFDIASRVFVNKNHEHILDSYDSHTVHYGYITDIRNNDVIDEVLITVMRAPNTYTREDTVEINCHGGVFVTQSVLEDVISAGAVLAEPGEFTKRAFINGRIDLTEAEAVMNLISSKSDTAVRNSLKQLSGKVRDAIVNLREDIIGEVAHIEAALDDPEHISLDGYTEHISSVMDNVSDHINSLIKSSDEGSLVQDGINTVIVGRPNVGKSSFLNIISGHDRAIVTDIAGTTRDAIEDTVRIDGIVFNLTDTAGIRDTDNTIEKIGVELAKKSAMDADLIIYVVDSSSSLTEDDRRIISMIKDHKVIVVLNKNDLEQVVTAKDIKELFSQEDIDVISFSAKTGEGTERFTNDVRKMFFSEELSGGDVLISNTRQKELLIKAADSIEKVKISIRSGMPEDFYSIDLRDAYESLGMIIGEEMNDDVIDSIFSRFCMGK